MNKILEMRIRVGVFLFFVLFGILTYSGKWSVSQAGNGRSGLKKGAVVTEGSIVVPGGELIVTPGAIGTPAAVTSPAALVEVKDYDVCFGTTTLNEALEWANRLTVYTDITLINTQEYLWETNIDPNVILHIPENSTLKVEEAKVVTSCGIIYNSGNVLNNGIICNQGKIVNTGSIKGGTITEDGVFEGNPACITDVFVEPYNQVFDGSFHEMIAKTQVQEGDMLLYSTDGVNYQEEPPLICYVNDTRDIYVRVLRGSIYAWESGRLEATVRPAMPAYTVPENVTAVYGQTLADLVGYLPEGMMFEQSLTKSVGIVGVHTFLANYTPVDTTNYVRVSGIKISVNVTKSQTQIVQDKIMLPRTIIKKGKLVYSVTKGVVGKCWVKVVKPKKKSYKTIVIPATIKYNGIVYKVKKIGKRAFEKNRKLKKVVIGKNVKYIENRAFANDRNLSVVRFKGDKLTKVGKKVTRHLASQVKIFVPKEKYAKYKRLIKKGRSIHNIKFYKS